MAVQFGTDGIRGVANTELTPELVLALGRAVARHLSSKAFLVGRDTRRSGAMLSGALASGIAAEGALVSDVGVLPTPAVAYLAQARNLPAAVISASHNPFFDNGIKLISPFGTKLDDALERAIEAELDEILLLERSRSSSILGPIGAGVGAIVLDETARAEYLEHLLSLVEIENCPLLVCVDAANGAASGVVGELFERAGVRAELYNVTPDGLNINDGCGSTHPERLAEQVVACSADLGLCLDGDADRLIAIDETGAIVDGDRLLALFAFDLLARKQLSQHKIAVTVMSNLGLKHALKEREIGVVETAVGDRNVYEAIVEHGLSLGGESSGHIIFSADATTGDGLLSALKLIKLVSNAGEPLSVLARQAMTPLPQVLRNVAVEHPASLAVTSRIWAEVDAVEALLGEKGRVLIRPSGTEKAIRVMVEAEGHDDAVALAERLCSVVELELGTPSDGTPPR